MSIEETFNGVHAELQKLNANFDRFFNAEGATAPKPRGRPPGSTNKTDDQPAVTIDQVKAIANKLAAEKGRPAALSLIKQHGSDDTASMDPSKYAAFIAAATVLMNQTPAPAAVVDAEPEL